MPTFLLVEGEPGIGKSRLLRELVRSARSSGVSVLEARGFETEVARPFGVWLAFASGDGERHPLTELGPEMGSAGGSRAAASRSRPVPSPRASRRSPTPRLGRRCRCSSVSTICSGSTSRRWLSCTP